MLYFSVVFLMPCLYDYFIQLVLFYMEVPYIYYIYGLDAIVICAWIACVYLYFFRCMLLLMQFFHYISWIHRWQFFACFCFMQLDFCCYMLIFYVSIVFCMLLVHTFLIILWLFIAVFIIHVHNFCISQWGLLLSWYACELF